MSLATGVLVVIAVLSALAGALLGYGYANGSGWKAPKRHFAGLSAALALATFNVGVYGAIAYWLGFL